MNSDDIKKAVAGTAIASVGAFMFVRYHVAGPSQYLVRTGLGIKDIKVSKKGIQWPLQTITMINVEPVTFDIEVDAMSKQRIPFKMPSVWTIGPKVDNNSLEKYSRLLSEKGESALQETVAGVIQGETRVLTANMDLDDLFSDRETFKHEVVVKINNVIGDLGLTVYNANIAELSDLDDKNQFFSQQKKRALQQVDQEARVHVAEAIKQGEIGEYLNKTETRQNLARLEKEAILVENDRDRDIAESRSKLAIAKAEYQKQTQIAEKEAEATAQQKDAEFQQLVEKARAVQEIEKQRANELSRVEVEAEIAIKRAEGEAEAVRINAIANYFAKEQEARAQLAMLSAESEGLSKLISSAGSIDQLNKYLLIERNVLPKLAEQQAKALQGLKPRVSVWSGGSGQSPLSETLTDLFKTGMPLFDTIEHQTGYDFMNKFGVQKKKE